ncbi:[histone H3]-lysine(4) N-trimethyltransferase [Ranunculus cassubicifolius]
MRTMNLGNDKHIDREFHGKCLSKTQVVNQFREKCVPVESSAGRVTIQALMAEPNCPWRHGKQSFKPPKSTSKGIKKKVDVVPNTFKSMCNNEDENEDYFWGDGEDEDSPPAKRSRNTFGGIEDNIQVVGSRKKVRKTLSLFQTVCRILLRGEEGKSNGVVGIKRVDLMAGTILRENNRCVNSGKQIIGPVPGVEVGDEFHYRVELAIIGLHRPYQAGIDYVDRGGIKLATSIVASGGYDDMTVRSDSDVLLYSGQGGNPTRGAKVATDQKLLGGNLAMVNSRKVGNDVRVIRGFRDPNSVDSRLNMTTLIYDGLYLVEDYWQQTGSYGNQVYMFQLRRKPGQPELAIKEIAKSRKSSVREGICVKDISAGKEKIPISAVNTVDSEIPPPFEYIARMKHPLRYKPAPSQGCQCSGGCSSSMKCSCAMKNGGQIPFNHNGAIVESRPLIYECGPHCKCPPSCYNKVSQRGIKFPLEVFKTKSRGWGIRSLSSIPSGSFICEYTGELLNEDDAEQRIGKDAYLFDIGRSNNDDALWEGLSNLIPSNLRSDSTFEAVEDVGFTIDAAHYGNVGRFINHSCSPNLYAQNVLYDHDDKRMPHIMFFATENIPPLKELTYHYNMAVNQVLDRDGNVRKMKCNCGSIECTGRIY